MNVYIRQKYSSWMESPLFYQKLRRVYLNFYNYLTQYLYLYAQSSLLDRRCTIENDLPHRNPFFGMIFTVV